MARRHTSNAGRWLKYFKWVCRRIALACAATQK